MGLIPLNLGDIANRVRRWTRAVGNLAIELEPTAKPVTILTDLSQVPYASDPRRFSIVLNSGFNSTNVPAIALQAGPGTAVVIEAIWLQSPSANDSFTLDVSRNITQATFNGIFTGITNPFSLSDAVNPSTVNTLQLCACRAGTTQNIGAFAATAIAQVFAALSAASATLFIQLPEPIVLFGGTAAPQATAPLLGDCFTITSTAVTQAVQVTLWGKEYTLTQGVAT